MERFLMILWMFFVILPPYTREEIINADVFNIDAKSNNTSEPKIHEMQMINEYTKSESNYRETTNFSILSLKDMFNVFDAKNIALNWSKISKSKISKNCTEQVFSFLKGLNRRQMWATKMNDASGHYTSGFFYGNNYWMGSMSLCESIYNPENENFRLNNEKGSKNSGLPFAAAHQHLYRSVRHQNPSFKPGFFILKMLFNITFDVQVIRKIYVGVCLPSACSIKDVGELVMNSQTEVSYRQVELIDIRVPTSNVYSLFQDSTFWILTVVSIIVFVLIIMGTFYETYLTNRFRRALREHEKEMINNSETSSGIGCGASDYSETVKNGLKNEFKGSNIVLSLPRADIFNKNMKSDEHFEGHIPEQKKLSVWSELLLSFSVITNFNAICDRNVGPDTIPSFHGLKAFSMAWIILGHTCIVIFKYSDNMEMRKEVEKNFFFQAITNGPFSVDTFFFLSGVLVSYIYFRTNAKGNLNNLTKGANELTTGLVHFTGLVGYRFVRLTAPYMYVLFVVQITMKYLDAFSIFDPPTMDHITCPKYWWRNLLYINTLFPVDEMCMLWSWYLANDTQFYIIGAIILIVAVRHFKLAATTMFVFLFSSWITTAIIAFRNNHKPNTDDPLALFDKIYDKPWTRLGPYLIGMSVGWILFKTNCKIHFSKTIVLVAWTLAMTNLFVLVFGLYNMELSQLTAAAYSSLSHSAWAMSLAWITIACSTGYGGLVNTILSAPCLYPFSRVTYCAYLVHPIVIRAMALSSDAPMHLGAESMIVTFFGLVVCSWILSFLVSLSFEAPVVTMLKILTPNRKKLVK
ncbi:nose resistant to fluoxetine protein 6 [Episyrphus balteatus]|uniref:nose resistant to fluoxetine protein 6 n=1 Tax=Episyrphus balteatus TaxID=286459 RepID=UPI0024861FDF|nr:nose resistant to fluoxetine protein 6 [Episyrphus balteatus]